MTMTDAAVPRGLKGVIVADTALGDVRGLEGFYHYRQYSAPELAATRTFEDVWYLLFDGELPVRRRARPRSSPRSRRCGTSPPTLLDAAPAPSPARRPRRWARCGPRCRTSPRWRQMPPTYDARPRRPSAPTPCASAR